MRYRRSYTSPHVYTEDNLKMYKLAKFNENIPYVLKSYDHFH